MRGDAVRRLQVIEGFLQDWDPLGVMTSVPRSEDVIDEYASYAPSIYRMLEQGCDVEDLIEHLEKIQSDDMGIPPTRERDLALARRVTEWWKTLSSE